MKTIVHYLGGSYLQKTETWIYGQIRFLTRYRPVVYCQNLINADSFPLETIRSLNFKEKQNLAFWQKAARKIWKYFAFFFTLRKDHPQVVHAHYGPAGYEFLPLKKLSNVPLITTFYGFDVNQLPTLKPEWKNKYRCLFHAGDLFLVEGSFMKSCLIKLGCDEKKVTVQHLGVDLERVPFKPRMLKQGEAVKILISSSFRQKKGIPYAIEAIGIFKRNYPETALKVTLLGDSGGTPQEENEKKVIFDLITTCGLKDFVEHRGYQPHSVFIEELYKNHLFLSPSVTAADGDTEGGAPVSIIEASASGMPVLSTTHCDIPEVVIDGQTGFLATERDKEGLAERLAFLIRNPNEWAKIGTKGREHIKKNYDVRTQAALLESIYDRVAK